MGLNHDHDALAAVSYQTLPTPAKGAQHYLKKFGFEDEFHLPVQCSLVVYMWESRYH